MKFLIKWGMETKERDILRGKKNVPRKRLKSLKKIIAKFSFGFLEIYHRCEVFKDHR